MTITDGAAASGSVMVVSGAVAAIERLQGRRDLPVGAHLTWIADFQSIPWAPLTMGASIQDDGRLIGAEKVRLSEVLDQARLLPHVTLYVHLPDTPTGVARVEDQAPITAGWVRRWFGSHCALTIKPVLVPEAQSPVDAWEVPARHREAVHVMSPADVFPWAANTTRHVQIEHTIAYDPHGPPGQSGVGNYGPLTAFHHRLKTHGG